MTFFNWIAEQSPLVILFITISLGYLVGKFKVGTFVLGGIAGTLLVGVVIGQLGVTIESGIKSIFFALFIYAVGYQGGPQFFRALSLRSLTQLISATLMCVIGLATVLGAAWIFDLDRGTAAGLAAGGLTQSAIIGTAGETIARLDVSQDLKQVMDTNIAVGYAVCYIFGSLGPIVMVTWFFPRVMKWDIRAEALKLAGTMSGGNAPLEPGQFNAAERVGTRFFSIGEHSPVSGQTVEAVDGSHADFALEAVLRNGMELPRDEATVLASGDIVALTGRIDEIEKTTGTWGGEVAPPDNYRLVLENRHVVLTNKDLAGAELQSIHGAANGTSFRDVFLTGVRRMGRDLPLLPRLQLHRGDEILLTGSPTDLDRAQKTIGYGISSAAVTDFIFFGLGMTVGLLMGLVQFKIAGIPVSVGSGGGCLLSGLLFGWLRSTHPRFAAVPTGATNFLRDFGLAVFVGIVGITAGPQVLKTLQEQGMTLFLLGVCVTIIPQIITFYFSYYVLRIRNPIEALACVAGGRSANPGFAALLDKAGNATPVVTFTVTYAVANVLLTLWGPLIVGIITTNPTQ